VLRIWGAAKVTFFNRRWLAKVFSMDEAAIELLELDVGGSFGVRGELYPEDFLVPFAALALSLHARKPPFPNINATCR
jgi:carbon-monoxide dehydrogenase large subunit